MFSLSINYNSLHTALDNFFREFFKSYSSDPMPFLYLFCKFFDVFVSIYWLRTIPFCGVAGVLKVIIDFTYLLNAWIILLIRYGWEILRAILVRSRLIVNPKSYSRGPVYLVAYSFLMHSIVSINSTLSPISSI